MDETPKSIKSPYFNKEIFQAQIEKIKTAAGLAEEIQDYKSAHDPAILLAIDIVEKFLKEKHRLCYGGQAINAHLPKRYKIYDPKTTVPDYDFFTPDQDADIVRMTQMLRKAGFKEISAREGIHAGTIKLYVNFIAVADITQIDPQLYKVLSSREFRSDGISYLDADTLRMMMYLELSRPMGEVGRWEKVYERLILLNEFVPIRACKGDGSATVLTAEETEVLMRKIVAEKKIFAGGDLVGFYKAALKKSKKPSASWLLYGRQPVIFYSSTLDADIGSLADLELDFKTHGGIGDIVPEMRVGYRGKSIAVIIIKESACHSYYTLPLRFGEAIRMASLDTLITLYFSIGLSKSIGEFAGALECAAQELVEISFRAREDPAKFPFDFISLKCRGHQETLPSLIRAKVRRMKTVKQKLGALIRRPRGRQTRGVRL
jgi:hypothetical protein